MTKKIDVKAFNEMYAHLIKKYPKTLEWARHKARWERITLGTVFNEYKSYIEELMQREDTEEADENT